MRVILLIKCLQDFEQTEKTPYSIQTIQKLTENAVLVFCFCFFFPDLFQFHVTLLLFQGFESIFLETVFIFVPL